MHDDGLAVGLDRSAGKLHFASAAIPSARFVCADGSALPYADDTFETVIIRDVLHHIPTPAETLERLRERTEEFSQRWGARAPLGFPPN